MSTGKFIEWILFRIKCVFECVGVGGVGGGGGKHNLPRNRLP